MSSARDPENTDPASRPGMFESESDNASAAAAEHPEPRAEPLARGAHVGRYVVVSLLGKGGMGEVYLAYDPELDRKVAVKVLQVASGAGTSVEQKQLRLLREAQAMARLSHPNVVAVHDVGAFGERVFLAMELVDGTTLRQWLKEAPRSRKQVLETLTAAGRGLVAAHAAGIVHRDFKPDNVLVGRDGAVKVTDFGLARAAADERPDAVAAEDDELSEVSSRGTDPLSAPLTRAGTLVGTPAYIAPEQYRGHAADARSDQFSFCISLYEALHGKRPYDAATLRGLGLNRERKPSTEEPTRPQRLARPPPTAPSAKKKSERGGFGELPNHAKVPAWLQRHLARGLSADPADRFESMVELLDALARDPAVMRRRVAFGGLAIGAVAAVFAVGIELTSAQCEAGADRFAAVWSPQRKAAVRDAFVTAGGAEAEAAFERIDRELERYASSWVGMYAAACRAHQVGEQPSEVLALRMTCLQRRLNGVDAVVKLFEKADLPLVNRSGEAVGALRGVSGCDNVEALMSPVAVPEDDHTRAQVEAVRAQLNRAEALLWVGSFKEGLPLAEAAVKTAATLGYRPLEADAYNLLGWLQHRLGQSKPSEQSRYHAVVAASAGNHDEVAAQAATELVFTLGLEQHRYEQAHFWARQAGAWIERLGGSDELSGKLANNRGVLAYAEGRYGDAIAEYQRALELRERVYGPDHLETAKVLGNLGVVYANQRKLDEAIAHYDRALTTQRRILGDHHPLVATSLVNLGMAYRAQGQFEAALEAFTGALEIRQRTVGMEHPLSWRLINDFGTLFELQGDLRRARERHEEALALAKKAVGDEHPYVASAMMALGGLLERGGELREALGLYERAHRINAERLGVKDNATTNIAEAIARAQLQLGRPRQALRLLEQTLAYEEEAVGTAHANLASCLRLIGEAHLALGERARALPPLERALAILSPLQLSAGFLAETRFALAKALGAADRDRAVALARAAREGFEEKGRIAQRQLAEVDRWLTANPVAAR